MTKGVGAARVPLLLTSSCSTLARRGQYHLRRLADGIQHALYTRLAEFRRYIPQTQTSYSERHRCGGATAAAGPPRVHRQPRHQQIRWSPLGAHLLVQIHTRVLDNTRLRVLRPLPRAPQLNRDRRRLSHA